MHASKILLVTILVFTVLVGVQGDGHSAGLDSSMKATVNKRSRGCVTWGRWRRCGRTFRLSAGFRKTLRPFYEASSNKKRKP